MAAVALAMDRLPEISGTLNDTLMIQYDLTVKLQQGARSPWRGGKYRLSTHLPPNLPLEGGGTGYSTLAARQLAPPSFPLEE